MTVTEYVRGLVRERAGNRCEYCLCHQDYVLGRLQIDHVRPIVKGGSDTEDNLCLACELCNQHKWTQTEDADPGQESVNSCLILGNSDGLSISPGVRTEQKSSA